MRNNFLLASLFLMSVTFSAQTKEVLMVPNENLITENILPIPKSISEGFKKYSESRSAVLSAVHPVDNSIIISTRFASVSQLHKIANPLGARKQITFFDEPVSSASFEPTKGEYLIYSKDIGGNEFGQLFKLDLKTMTSTMLTDGGRSQNGGVRWLDDGSGFY